MAVDLLRIIPKQNFLLVFAERVSIEIIYPEVSFHRIEREKRGNCLAGLVAEHLYSSAVVGYGGITCSVSERAHLLYTLWRSKGGSTIVIHSQRRG